MYERVTLLGRRVGNAIRCGNVFVSPAEIQDYTALFAEPLFLMDGQLHELLGDNALSRVGTATRIRFNGNPYLLATSHQIKSCDPSGVCIHDPDANSFTTCSTHSSFGHNEDSGNLDRHDIEVFGFSGAEKSGRVLGSFFPIPFARAGFSNENIVSAIVTGFPYQESSWETELGELKLRPFSFIAEFSGAGSGNYLKCTTDEPIDHDPDGLSGSPVFFLLYERGEFRIELAGILSTANRTVFHFISLAEAATLLNRYHRDQVDSGAAPSMGRGSAIRRSF